MAGHIFAGAGVELTPKNFKFAAMYGRLKKAVEFDEFHVVFRSGLDAARFHDELQFHLVQRFFQAHGVNMRVDETFDAGMEQF